MKSVLVKPTVILFIGLCLSACSSKQDNVNKSICPKLSIENSTSEQIELSKIIAKDLRELSTIQDIYYDVLKKYNNTDNVDKYITKDGLEELGQTNIFGTLIAMKTLSNHKLGNNEKSENIYTKSYQDILNTIDSKNDNWCNQESYKHIVDETKK